MKGPSLSLAEALIWVRPMRRGKAQTFAFCLGCESKRFSSCRRARRRTHEEHVPLSPLNRTVMLLHLRCHFARILPSLKKLGLLINLSAFWGPSSTSLQTASLYMSLKTLQWPKVHNGVNAGLAVVDVLHIPLNRLTPPAILGHVGQRWLAKHAILTSPTKIETGRKKNVL